VFEIECCTSTLCREAADRTIPQRSLAVTYALAMRSGEKTDWRKVNRAIIAHRSRAALNNIKRLAWIQHDAMPEVKP